MARLIGYARVSTSNQVEGTSLRSQRDKIERYCYAFGHELVAMVCDEGVSASKVSFDKRAGGKEIFSLLSQGKAEGVVSIRLDRMFRRTRDALGAIEALGDKSLHIIDMGGQAVDTSSAVGRLFITMLAAIGQMESDLLSEKMSTMIAQKKRDGRRHWGLAPYGWENSDGDVVEVADEQCVLELLVTYRNSGYTYKLCADLLNEAGHRRRSGAYWDKSSTKRAWNNAQKMRG